MKKKRLIPVLLLKNGFLVQSKSFSRHQNLGDPITAVKRLSDWAADELVFLDITRDGTYDMRRDDKGHPNRNNIIDIIRDISEYCHMPVTFGGKIRAIEDVALRISNGADKVSINTIAIEKPDFISQAAREFGSQCIVVSMDVKRTESGLEVMKQYGKVGTGMNPVDWAKRVQDLGAGEIFLNSVDRDGMKKGYDIELLRAVSGAVKIPVIACGGVGEWGHFGEALEETEVDAVAAANIFHYYDQSVYLAKKYLFENHFLVRKPDLILTVKEL